MRAKKTLAVVAVSFLLVILTVFFFRTTAENGDALPMASAESIETSTVSGKPVVPAREISDGGRDSLTRDELEEAGEIVRLDKYQDYLDSLCPQLTLQEQERLLAETGRSAKAISALLWMTWPMSDKLVKEARRNFPDDPMILFCLIGKNIWSEEGEDLTADIAKLKEVTSRNPVSFAGFVIDGGKVGRSRSCLFRVPSCTQCFPSQ